MIDKHTGVTEREITPEQIEEQIKWVNDKAREYGKGRTRDEARRQRMAAGAPD